MERMKRFGSMRGDQLASALSAVSSRWGRLPRGASDTFVLNRRQAGPHANLTPSSASAEPGSCYSDSYGDRSEAGAGGWKVGREGSGLELGGRASKRGLLEAELDSVQGQLKALDDRSVAVEKAWREELRRSGQGSKAEVGFGSTD